MIDPMPFSLPPEITMIDVSPLDPGDVVACVLSDILKKFHHNAL
jgi:hypothetical protein